MQKARQTRRQYAQRQGALLTVLGIRSWVPRATGIIETKRVDTVLWRDTDEVFFNDVSLKNHELNDTNSSAIAQATSDASEIIPALETNQISLATALTQNVQADSPANAQANSLNAVDFTKFEPVNNVDATQADELLDKADLTVVPKLSFRLQAVEINNWIILLNDVDLQQPEHAKLWQNILLAFKQPAIAHFSWPLSDGQRWQRSIGAKAALSGFLFKLGLDKRIGLMGNIPDEACPERIERLPDLSELIEQPLKKRLLWNLLQEKI